MENIFGENVLNTKNNQNKVKIIGEILVQFASGEYAKYTKNSLELLKQDSFVQCIMDNRTGELLFYRK